MPLFSRVSGEKAAVSLTEDPGYAELLPWAAPRSLSFIFSSLIMSRCESFFLFLKFTWIWLSFLDVQTNVFHKI